MVDAVKNIVDTIKTIENEVATITSAEDMTHVLEGSLRIVNKVLEMLKGECKTQAEDLAVASRFMEKIFDIVAFVALPELAGDRQFYKEQEVQTNLTERRGIPGATRGFQLALPKAESFDIPHCDRDHYIPSPRNNDCVTAGGTFRRGQKPILSPLPTTKGLQSPNATAQKSFVANGSFYFSKSQDPPRGAPISALRHKVIVAEGHPENSMRDPAKFAELFSTAVNPFGEVLFLDPCSDGYVRYPVDDIHRYLGIIMLRGQGEVCLWNPKMVESTGILETDACGSHITAFLLTVAEQEEMNRLIDACIEEQDAQTGKFSLSCQDGANRCVVSLTLMCSVFPGKEYLIAFCHERVPAEARIDCIQWTVTKLKTHVEQVPDCEAKKRLKESVIKLDKVCARQGARAWGRVAVADLFGRLGMCYNEEAKSSNVQLSIDEVPVDVPLEIETDVKNLPRILGYLVHNAIRFCNKPESLVTLSVCKEEGEEPGTSCIIFSIQDNGPGVPTETMDKIASIATADEICNDADEADQTGFGLVMTSLLVTESGGSLEMSSDPIDGTTARVILPLLDSQETDVMTPATREPLGFTIRSILIQPNAVHRAAICHYLWQRKYAVSIYSSLEGVDFDVEFLVMPMEDEATADTILDKLKLFPQVQVMLTSTEPGEGSQRPPSVDGVFFLQLPLKPNYMLETLTKIEEKTRQHLEQKTKIDQVRKAFQGETHTCPWERKGKLGSGSFGEVYEAINTITKGVMAVKILRLDKDNEDKALDVLNEVQLMNKLQHPNIIHYFHSQLEDHGPEQQLLIFMEYASGGTLKDKLKGGVGLAVDLSSSYTTDVLRGLHYLHSKDIIHRDIKTANILISVNSSGNEICKMTDFGTAKEIKKIGDGEADGLARSLKGTPNFMAPEVMNEEPYDHKADIWSIGCLVLELITGKPPFSHISENPWNIIRYVSSLHSTPGEGPFEYTAVDYGPYTFLPVVMLFLKQTIVVNQKKRLCCEQLLGLPFIAEMNRSYSNRTGIADACKKASLAQVAKVDKRHTKITFGDKWKDDDSQDSEFSGWGGSDSDEEVTPPKPQPKKVNKVRSATISKQLVSKELRRKSSLTGDFTR